MEKASPLTLEQLLDPALTSELKRIELRTRRTIDSDLMGQYRSAFRGSGLLFSDIREYQIGDDVKKIHWKMTARSDKVYVKSYEEDRQLNIILAVDISNSTNFGSHKTKHQSALEFSALIALLAKASQDFIGLCLFSDKIEEFIPVSKSRGHVQRILMKILAPHHLPRATDLKSTLEFLNKNQKRSSIIFIISDFYSPPFDHELKMLGLKHDVVCVLLEDSLDTELPSAGIVEFYDAESGERYLLDTGSKNAGKEIKRLQQARIESLSQTCKLSGVDFLRIKDNPLRSLAQLMNTRAARLR